MAHAKAITIKRTESSDPDFPYLVALLNQELHEQYGEVQLIYDKFNAISDLGTVVIAYVDDSPVGCACFKKFDYRSAEVKRMFVKPEARKEGIATLILSELEGWAKEDGYPYMVLETANKQLPAITFYQKADYKVIPNYGPYIGIDTSICMEKKL